MTLIFCKCFFKALQGCLSPVGVTERAVLLTVFQVNFKAFEPCRWQSHEPGHSHEPGDS